jgi:hypothetical protein
MKPKTKFDYGNFIIEYRIHKDGFLNFLKKKITNTSDALNEATALKDKGYYDVLIRTKDNK